MVGSGVPDEIFANPRLAAIYDLVDADRSDLDHYVAIAEEFGAADVLDVGCGTGTLACMLTGSGYVVVGVDPAQASLDVARLKPYADRVRWIRGDATALDPLSGDLAVMTGNVAQVFTEDAAWVSSLTSIRNALRQNGYFVFETRDPSMRAWENWTREHSFRVVPLETGDEIETWIDLLDVSLPFVSFRHSYRFSEDGAFLTSDSTLRFRSHAEIAESLKKTGYVIDSIRDAPDRPGKEWVYVAQKAR